MLALKLQLNLYTIIIEPMPHLLASNNKGLRYPTNNNKSV